MPGASGSYFGPNVMDEDELEDQEAEVIHNTYLNSISRSESPISIRGQRPGAILRPAISGATSEADLRCTISQSYLGSVNEHSGLLTRPDGRSSRYGSMSTASQRPPHPIARSRSFNVARRRFTRRLSIDTKQADAQKPDTYVDNRVWYDQFTSIDWVYDSIENAHRTQRLNSRKDFKGRIIRFMDAAQGWLLSLLVGCVTAGFAYVVDVSEATVFDFKAGYCSDAWWSSRRRCCEGADLCDQWRRWSDGLGVEEANAGWFNFSAYVLWVVALAVIGCLITLLTRTAISPASSLSTLDENLGADRPRTYGKRESDSPGASMSPISRYRVASKRPPVVYYPAAGSGVAEVRVILSGFVLHGYLGVRTLVAKTVALVFSVASGLSIGKEGPYVHIGTCVGNIACRLSSKFKNNDSKRREILSAAAAAGVAVAFGAPIGGVLFSLEEVSYYFPRRMLFRTFFCTIAAALSLKFLNPYGTNKIVLFEVRYLTEWKVFEISVFCLLGILGGALGALFIKASRFWARRFRGLHYIKAYPVFEVVVVALVTGLVSFWNRYTRLPVAELLYELAAPCNSFSDTGDTLCPTEEKIPLVIGTLSVAFVVKAFLTTVTFGIKVPAGIYVPAMVVGGFLGRIVGHALQAVAIRYPGTLGCPADGNLESCVVPGIYALVAAGATMCGVTRLSITLAVILFELTGSLAYVLPFSLGVLIAKWTADAIEPLSIYDLLTNMNSYPYLDSKDRPFFTTDLGDITPIPHANHVIDISISSLVPAAQLRMKLEYMQMSGELDGGLPIVRNDILIGLMPAPSLEFALDNLPRQDGDGQEQLCLLEPYVGHWRGRDHKTNGSVLLEDVEVTSSPEDLESAETAQLLSPPAKPDDPTDFTSYIDRAPVALDVNSPMDLVFECFVKLGLRYICVLREGRFMGLVHKKAFVRRPPPPLRLLPLSLLGLLAREQPRVITASSQKKRKLAQNGANLAKALQPQQSRPRKQQTNTALFDPSGSDTGPTRSSPSSSPQRNCDSGAPSPTSSNTTPPRFLPPHLHDEVLPSKEDLPGPGGFSNQSVSDIDIVIDGVDNGIDNGSADMSGRENGERGVGSGANRTSGHVGTRAASPAKRSAADMEDTGGHKSTETPVPGSFSSTEVDGPLDFDVAMSGMTPAATNGLETQDTASNSLDTSLQASSASTSATSFDMDAPPPYSAVDESQLPAAHQEPYSTDRIDRQYSHVSSQMEKPVGEGDRGVIISQKWLNRVMSRTTEGLKSGTFPKDAREGIVGPVDNSDIIAENGLREPLLHDLEDCAFVPLKPGLAINEDYRVVPKDAYDFIVGEYGYKSKFPIVRYAHDTTQGESTQQNFQYEVYPPSITIRKVSSNESSAQPKKALGSLQALHQKTVRAQRGQLTEDDAIHLVSSRSERFQSFLARSKEAADIPRANKVKLWRLLSPTNVDVDKPGNAQPGVLSPPASRDNSPSSNATRPTDTKLALDGATFDKMQLGIDLEFVDARDETNNDKYNGKSTMETVALNTDQTIILEEQIGGPAGGEFQSDSKKALNISNKRANGAKPGSAPVSGRTSPALGGIITRGRARRDGRTRGTVGLTNLGNTCYMNSALQCIRSVEELAVFFASTAFKKEINNDNPLGYHGAMANAYANVVRGIYDKTAAGAFTPSEFKKRLGNSQPLFSGYGQQDSQEFLSFLVDALHEDLNRIKKKPYNENPDSDDKTVHDPKAIIELGETYRRNHRARNDSVAMDLFSGFYKNTMECPVCDKISITFDPFSLVTVQLPVENNFSHTITFFPLHGAPVNHTLDIDKNATIKAAKESIAKKHPGVSADRLWMVEVYSHKLYRVFEDNVTVAEANIVNNDYIFMYELDNIPKNLASPKKQAYYSSYYRSSSDDSVPAEGMDSAKADSFAIPIFQRKKNGLGNHSIALHPLYVSLTREEATNYDIILKKVLIAVSNITSRPILTEATHARIQRPSSKITEVDQELSVNDEAVGVSDHSTPSEDGYVNVSLGKPVQTIMSQNNSGSASPMQIDEPQGKIPSDFMDPTYFIDPALSQNLFEMKVAKSSDNMHCASMQSFLENSLRPMFDRVKPATRRSSIQSTSSDDSTSSTVSDDPVNITNDESDDDYADKPDITLGESTLSSTFVQDSDDDSGTPLQGMNNARSGRQRRNRGKRDKRGKRGSRMTYGQKDRTRYNQNRANGGTGLISKLAPEDGMYYVQLGEAIVLDWRPEAFDGLFGGDPTLDGDMRGHRLSTDDGKQVEFFHDPELIAKKKRREERKRHGIDLEDCFVETGKREVLSEDNAWYCNRCKEMRRAAKTLEIWTIPDILVVHLKRFGGNRSFRDKIDVLVDYPITGLDMSDKVGMKEPGKEYIYDLFAVDNHYGGLGGGHYTAMAKNFYDGQWYDYNDSSCTKISNDAKLQSAAAYLLFYRRRSEAPLGPQYLQDLVHEARYPASADTAVDDADDSESGEGRLGGPTLSSLHGSSSGSTGAGVVGTRATAAARGLDAPAGGQAVGVRTPVQAATPPTTRLTRTTNRPNSPDGDERFGAFTSSPSHTGPAPGFAHYGTSDAPAWSFASLQQRETDDNSNDDEDDTPAADHLLGNMGGADADAEDDDAASTTAEMDRDSAYGDSNGHIEFIDEDVDVDFPDSSSRMHHDFAPGRNNSPAPGFDVARRNVLAATATSATIVGHVEDSSMSGLDDNDDHDDNDHDSSSSPAAEIHLDADDHLKVD